MALDGTYETKLLRILIGYFHVTLLEQMSQTRYGKSVRDLTQEERDSLQTEMTTMVSQVAGSISESALDADPYPTTVH